MAAQKYQELAREYLLEEIDALAAWLEAHVNAIKADKGEDVKVFIERGGSLKANDLDWHYANITFDLTSGHEVIA